MGIDITIELKGFRGESKSTTGAMDVTDVSFSTRIPRDVHTLQPMGKREHSGVTIVKPTDAATPLLMKALWENQKIDTGTIIFRKAGGDQYEYMKVILTEVYVASFHFNAAEAGEDLPTETLLLVYRKIEVTYKEQSPKGTMGGTTVAVDELSTAS